MSVSICVRDSGEDVDTSSVTVKLQDEIKQLDRFRFSAKLWSVDACLDAAKALRVGNSSCDTIHLVCKLPSKR